MNEALLYGDNIKCKYFSWYLLILYENAVYGILSEYCLMAIILSENIALW